MLFRSLDLAIGRQISLVFELAHALINEAGQIGNAVGNRSIDREAAAVDDTTAQLLATSRALR